MASLRKHEEDRVASVAVFRDGKMLFGKRKDNGKWTMPAGHLLVGEDPEEGALRELFEETGLKPDSIKFLGSQTVNGKLEVFAYRCDIPEGQPHSDNDPDEECSEWEWFKEPPEEQHVPRSKNVVLKLIDGPQELSKAVPFWRASDGLKLPKHGTPERNEWNKKYHEQLVRVFANGDANRLKSFKLPVSPDYSGHFLVGAVGAGGRDRRKFYKRIALAGEPLPPVVVRRNGNSWHVIDGNARMDAAVKAGIPHVDAYELVEPAKPKNKKNVLYKHFVTGEIFDSFEDIPEELKGDKFDELPDLEKGLSGLVLGAALAGAPMHHDTTKDLSQIAQESGFKKWTPDSLHEGLIPIAHLESSFGTKMEHKPNAKGEYHTAYGALGMKPVTAHEEWKRNKSLQTSFPGLHQPVDFVKEFKSNPKMYNTVASAHWSRLLGLLKSPEKAAYGWRWGYGAAHGASREKIAGDSYVKAYQDLHHKSGLKKADTDWTPEELEAAVNSPDDETRYHAARTGLLNEQQIEKLLNDKQTYIRGMALAAHKDTISQDRLERTYADPNLRSVALTNPRIPQKFIEEAYNNGNYHDIRSIIDNPSTPDHVLISAIDNTKDRTLGESVLRRKNLSPQVVLHAAKNGNKDVKRILVHSLDKFQNVPGLQETLLQDKDPQLRERMAYNIDTKPEILKQIYQQAESPYTKALVVLNSSVPNEIVDHFIDTSEPAQIRSAISDGLLSQRHINVNHLQKIAGFDDRAARSLFNRGQLSPEMVEWGLKNPNEDIRYHAYRSPSVTDKQIEEGLSNPETFRDAIGGINNRPNIINAMVHPANPLHIPSEFIHSAVTQATNWENSRHLTQEGIRNAVKTSPGNIEEPRRLAELSDFETAKELLKNPSREIRDAMGASILHGYNHWITKEKIRDLTDNHGFSHGLNMAAPSEDEPNGFTHMVFSPEEIKERLPKHFDNLANSNNTSAFQGIMHKANLSHAELVHYMNKLNPQDRYHQYIIRDLKQKIAENDPDAAHTEHVHVAFDTNKYRKARDFIQSKGVKELPPKQMPAGDWSVGRLPNGNISADKLQEHIDKQPRTKYNISHTTWGQSQRHNDEPSQVMQVNATTDQLNKMKAEGVFNTYQKMNDASYQSGHPVARNIGLGWIRYTGNPKTGFFVDEVQSDLGQSFVRQAAAQARAEGLDENEAAEEAEKQYPEEHYKKIKSILFGNKHPNEMLSEAFHQYQREKGHYDTPVHVHTVESKAPISLGEELPPVCKVCGKHPYHEDHDPSFSLKTSHPYVHGVDRTAAPGHFNVTYHDVPKKMGKEPAKYGDLPTQTGEELLNRENGKGPAPTWGGPVRKTEEIFETLAKAYKDIPLGKQVQSTEPGTFVYDYSSLLPKKVQDSYSLEIHHMPEYDSLYGKVKFKGPNGNKIVGRLTGGYDNKNLEISTSNLDHNHRGQGLGKTMYEAMIAHAYHKLGVKTVSGEEHSSLAHNVHQSLSQKHNTKYQAKQIGKKTGEYDEAFGPYSYSINNK